MQTFSIRFSYRTLLVVMLALVVALPAGLGIAPAPAYAALTSIVDENFNAMTTGSFPAGWTLENGAGGTVTVENVPSSSDKSMRLNDTSTSNPLHVSKWFTAPAGLITVEFDIRPSQTSTFIAAGYLLSANGQRANTVYFENTVNEIRAWNGSTAETVQTYTANTWYHMKYVIDTFTKKYDVYVDGVLKKQNLAFHGTPTAVSKILFFTGTGQTGSVYVDNVKVSSGGMLKLPTNKVFDDFNSVTIGSAPTGWTLDNVTGGSATVQGVPSASDRSVMLNDTSTVSGQNVSISKTFSASTGKLTAEFEVMAGQTNAIIAVGYLQDNSGNLAARVYFNASGEIRAYNGSGTELVQLYEANKWYRIKLVLNATSNKYDIYVNGVLKKSNLSFNTPVTSISKISFYTSSTYSGVLYVDNVNISGEGELESTNYGSTYNATGEPIGGGEGYSRLVNSWTTYVSTASDLINALNNATSGDVIYVDDNADLNLDGYTLPLKVKAGVTLASGRGKIINGALSQGARLRVTPGPSNKKIVEVIGEGARITGLRFYGGDPTRGDLVTRGLPWTNGIYAWGYNTTEIDNNEFRGFRWAGVAINDGYVHHNTFDDNPYWEYGYGIVQDGSNTTGGLLIEGNLFDNNRHAIASTGKSTSRYEARYNTTLVNNVGHAFDMHGNSACSCAGDWVKIHHNTFQDTSPEEGIMIRDVPVTGAYIHNNWFYDPDTQTDIVQILEYSSSYGKMFVGTNKYGTGSGIQYLTNVYGKR